MARKSFQVSVQISASDSYDDDDYDDDDVFGDDDDDASSSRRVEWHVFPGCNSDETYYEQTFTANMKVGLENSPTYLASPFCSTWPVSIVRAGWALEG